MNKWQNTHFQISSKNNLMIYLIFTTLRKFITFFSKGAEVCAPFLTASSHVFLFLFNVFMHVRILNFSYYRNEDMKCVKVVGWKKGEKLFSFLGAFNKNRANYWNSQTHTKRVHVSENLNYYYYYYLNHSNWFSFMKTFMSTANVNKLYMTLLKVIVKYFFHFIFQVC